MTTPSFTQPKLAEKPVYVILFPGGVIYSDYDGSNGSARSFYRVSWYDLEPARAMIARYPKFFKDATIARVHMTFEIVP